MSERQNAESVAAMSDDDPYFGKVYDEDGYCVACGNGKWKHHMPQCEIADLIDKIGKLERLLDDAVNGCSPEWIIEQRAHSDAPSRVGGQTEQFDGRDDA